MTQRRRFLQITSYPPPRAGWGVRVQFLKRHLEALGHECVVLNTGPSRRLPSTEYDTVLGGRDFLTKVWRYSREGYVVHAHMNAKSPKGFVLAFVGMAVNLACGHRPYLTFHAGERQRFFPLRVAPHVWPVLWTLFTLPRAIVCNSAGIKDRIVQYGIAARKIVPIQAFSRQYLEFTPVSLGPAADAFYARHSEVLLAYVHMQPGYHPDVLMTAFGHLAARRPTVGLAICGMMGHREPGVWDTVDAIVTRLDLGGRLCLIDDFDHDQFLTALTRSALYVRTPPGDGVASSVLEALSLGIPVVGSDNGTRPPGVVLYPTQDPEALANVLEHVLTNRSDVVRSITKPHIPDSLAEEAALLLQEQVEA